MLEREKSKIVRIRRHFRRADPVLFSALAKTGLELLRGEGDPKRYFARLCREIISQQLAGRAAQAIHERFLELFPEKHPTPRRVLKFSEKRLRRTGMSWAKTKYLRDLAQKTLDGDVLLKKLAAMDNEEAIAELVKVKGIGRWTAEMFLMFALAREDVFSFGDLGLQKGFAKLYGAGAVGKRRSIERITKKWSPYRSYGSQVLWRALESGT